MLRVGDVVRVDEKGVGGFLQRPREVARSVEAAINAKRDEVLWPLFPMLNLKSAQSFRDGCSQCVLQFLSRTRHPN
jgi:hypothetical protein